MKDFPIVVDLIPTCECRSNPTAAGERMPAIGKGGRSRFDGLAYGLREMALPESSDAVDPKNALVRQTRVDDPPIATSAQKL